MMEMVSVRPFLYLYMSVLNTCFSSLQLDLSTKQILTLIQVLFLEVYLRSLQSCTLNFIVYWTLNKQTTLLAQVFLLQLIILTGLNLITLVSCQNSLFNSNFYRKYVNASSDHKAIARLLQNVMDPLWPTTHFAGPDVQH